MKYLRALAALGCLAACSTDPGASQTRPVTYVYRVVDSDSLRLYVFSPADTPVETRASVVLLYHGGGWTVGSPDWTFSSAREFAERGLVAISVQYRLSGAKWTPLDALADVCESLRWTRRHSDELHIDSTRLIGYGVSAGGHLVASTATVGCRGTDAGERSAPDLLLLWSPGLDVAGDGWFIKQLQGRAQPDALSPAQHVHAGTPPTSIVSGDMDSITPLAGARRYCARLEALGTRCELNVYAGVGHLLTRNLANQESDFDPDPVAKADAIAKHIRFLRSLGF